MLCCNTSTVVWVNILVFFQNSRLKSSHNLQSTWPSRGLTRSCRTLDGIHLLSAVQGLLERICFTGRFVALDQGKAPLTPISGNNHGPPRQPVPGWSVLPYNSLPHRLPLQAPKGKPHLSSCIFLVRASIVSHIMCQGGNMYAPT